MKMGSYEKIVDQIFRCDRFGGFLGLGRGLNLAIISYLPKVIFSGYATGSRQHLTTAAAVRLRLARCGACLYMFVLCPCLS